MTNQSKNTATVVAEDYSTKNTTWADSNYTWAEGAGTWENPYSLGNQTKNTGTITNITKS